MTDPVIMSEDELQLEGIVLGLEALNVALIGIAARQRQIVDILDLDEDVKTCMTEAELANQSRILQDIAGRINRIMLSARALEEARTGEEQPSVEDLLKGILAEAFGPTVEVSTGGPDEIEVPGTEYYDDTPIDVDNVIFQSVRNAEGTPMIDDDDNEGTVGGPFINDYDTADADSFMDDEFVQGIVDDIVQSHVDLTYKSFEAGGLSGAQRDILFDWFNPEADEPEAGEIPEPGEITDSISEQARDCEFDGEFAVTVSSSTEVMEAIFASYAVNMMRLTSFVNMLRLKSRLEAIGMAS